VRDLFKSLVLRLRNKEISEDGEEDHQHKEDDERVVAARSLCM
jgi:hypothetical protein